MPRLDRTNIQRWAPMRKDDDINIGLFKVCDLRVEPGKIPRMRLVVHADVPVAGLEKVIEPAVDRHLSFRRDGRKEAAVQNGNVRAGQLEGCVVEQYKLSQ